MTAHNGRYFAKGARERLDGDDEASNTLAIPEFSDAKSAYALLYPEACRPFY